MKLQCFRFFLHTVTRPNESKHACCQTNFQKSFFRLVHRICALAYIKYLKNEKQMCQYFQKHPVGGGWCDPPPWRFQTKRRRALQKRPADCSRRVLAIGGIMFGPRSIFDPVMAGQRSNFRKFHDFSTSRVDGIKTICRSVMKPSPACSPFNYA